MKKSYINDFEFLKSIYKHSQNLAVTPLTKKNGKIWGAVSIDNDSNTDLFSGKENLMNSCMKIIQEVI